MLAALAYAAVAQAAPDAPAGGEVDAAVANGQPKGPAVLTSPPSHGGKVVDVAIVGATGVAATVTAARGGDADDRVGSVSLSTRRLGYANDRGLLVRVVNTGELGGNDRGVHGGLSFEVAGGYRFPVAETHGPFIRGGALGRVDGDALVYQSLLEVPQAHAGYQYQKRDLLLEIAGRAGFGELGRSNTGYHATRHVDESLDLGAIVTVRAPHVLLLGEWSHLLPAVGLNSAKGPIDWLDAGLCATWKRLAMCTDFRLVAGDVNRVTGGPTSSSVTQLGITLGMAGK